MFTENNVKDIILKCGTIKYSCIISNPWLYFFWSVFHWRRMNFSMSISYFVKCQFSFSYQKTRLSGGWKLFYSFKSKKQCKNVSLAVLIHDYIFILSFSWSLKPHTPRDLWHNKNYVLVSPRLCIGSKGKAFQTPHLWVWIMISTLMFSLVRYWCLLFY
jgi:hypothetical protein